MQNTAVNATTLTIVAPFQRPALTARGHALVAALRLHDLVRDLDAADRAYVAPYIAEALVEAARDVLDPEADHAG
jgi:hypothetical protein